MRYPIFWVATGIAASLVVVACSSAPSTAPSSAPSTDPSTRPSGSPIAALPTAPGTERPGASSPPIESAPRPLGWVQIGDVGGGSQGYVGTPVAFDGGFVAWGARDADEIPVAWYSADGHDWVSSDLAKSIKPCPGWVARPDGEVSAGATNGQQVLLVGLEYAPDAAECGTWRAAAWITSDGRTWQRAPGFGTGPDNVWAHDVWATPNGWEVAMGGVDGLSVWQSADGLDWDQAAVLIQGEDVSLGAVAIDATGTRLVVAFDSRNETSRVLVSKDGRTWRQIDGPSLGSGSIARFLAPKADAAYWIAVTTDDGGDHTTIWKSTDLEHWTAAPFPMPAVDGLGHTAFGLLALGEDPCRDTGGSCDVDPPQYFISADGVAWTPLRATFVAEGFVEGRAGVIAVGRVAEPDGPQPIWRLESYSAEEAFLLAGLRSDAKFACSPRRIDLPAAALAGVECAPGISGVDRIGVYLFDTADDLLKTYFARLAASDVEPRSGSCPKRAGERAYVPGDDGLTYGPYRLGCYLNEFGNANYRFTVPDSLVYAGILGTGKDLAALDKWAWQGNLDVPGAPTVWRDPTR